MTAAGAPARRVTAAATLVAGFAVLGAVFFGRQAPLFVVDEIGAGFGVRAEGHGALALGIGGGWGVGMLLAGWSSGRWRHRTRVLVGTLGAAAGVLAAAAAPSWPALVAAQAVACCFAGSSTPAMLSLAYGAVPRHRRGLAAGTVLSASRIGGNLLAPVAVVGLSVAVSWRLGMVLASVLLVGAAVVVAVRVPAGPRPPRSGPRRKLRYHPGGRRNLVISAANCTALVLWLTVVSQFGVAVLREWTGSGPAAAGVVLGAFGVGSALAAFAVPVWSDRIGRRIGQAASLALGAVSGLLVAVLAARGIGSLPVALVLLFAGGGALGGLPMALSLIPAEAVAAGDPGRAMVGPTLAAEVVGGAVLPALVTVAAARTSPSVAVGIAAGLLGVGAVASSLLVAPPAAGEPAVEDPLVVA